jgi:hypothetical protein
MTGDGVGTPSARPLPPPPPPPSVSLSYRNLSPASLAWLGEALSAWQAHHVRYFGGEAGASAAAAGPLSSGSLELLLQLAPQQQQQEQQQQQARLLPVFADVPLSAARGGGEAEGGGLESLRRPATLRPSPAASRLASRRFNEGYERAVGAVPRFDRVAAAAAAPASRSAACFNCSSPAHALRDCPHARDHAAIGAARSAFAERQAAGAAAAAGGGGTAAAPRYFDEPAGGEAAAAAAAQATFAAPGKLSEETRTALRIGPNDPPPWIWRMRQLGYPQAWIKKRAKSSSETDGGGGAKRTKRQKKEAPLELPPELKAITRERTAEAEEEEEEEGEEEEGEEEEGGDDDGAGEEELGRLVQFEGFDAGWSDDDDDRRGYFRGAGISEGAEGRQRRSKFAAAAAAAAVAHLAAAQRRRSGGEENRKRPRSDGGGDGGGETAARREAGDFGYSDLGDHRDPARVVAAANGDGDEEGVGEIEDGELGGAREEKQDYGGVVGGGGQGGD